MISMPSGFKLTLLENDFGVNSKKMKSTEQYVNKIKSEIGLNKLMSTFIDKNSFN